MSDGRQGAVPRSGSSLPASGDRAAPDENLF